MVADRDASVEMGRYWNQRIINQVALAEVRTNMYQFGQGSLYAANNRNRIDKYNKYIGKIA
jgi:hypothetical protein